MSSEDQKKTHWWDKERFYRPPVDARQQRQMAQEVAREKAEALNQMWIEDREKEYAVARERARLSMLTLTERDKRFLKSVKVAI